MIVTSPLLSKSRTLRAALMSERTGSLVVRMSMTGWIGLRTFWTLSRIGLAKLLKNSPALSWTLVKPTVGFEPNELSGDSIGALAKAQWRAKSLLIVGKFAPPPKLATR